MARSGARSAQRVFLAIVFAGAFAGVAFGIWSLRPIPSYASESVLEGSPFDVAFRVDNTDPWFALSNLKISCILAHVRASGIPPSLLEASDVRFPGGNNARLEPGESATFRCPFRSLMGHPANDDPGIAQRAEIYFRAEYDAPLLGSFRLWENSGHFFLNTRVLPPRWTGTPQG